MGLGASHEEGQTVHKLSTGEERELLAEFRILAQHVDPRFGGEIQLLQNIKTGENLFRRESRFTSAQQLQEFQQSADAFIHLHDAYLLACQHLKVTDEDQFCGSMHEVVLYVEYLEQDLEGLIGVRAKEGRSFLEEEIASTLNAVLRGLLALRSADVYHGGICSKNILCNADGTVFKIFDYKFFSGSSMYTKIVMGLEEEISEHDPLYLSPELFAQYCDKELRPADFDREKSEVFSLGLCGLAMATLGPIAALYDHDEKTVNAQAIEGTIESVAKEYSSELALILSEMLQINVQKRCDFFGALHLLQTFLDRRSKRGNSESQDGVIALSVKKITTNNEEEGEELSTVRGAQQQLSPGRQAQTGSRQNSPTLKGANEKNLRISLTSSITNNQEDKVNSQIHQVSTQKSSPYHFREALSSNQQINNARHTSQRKAFQQAITSHQKSESFTIDEPTPLRQIIASEQRNFKDVARTAAVPSINDHLMKSNLVNVERLILDALEKSLDTKERFESFSVQKKIAQQDSILVDAYLTKQSRYSLSQSSKSASPKRAIISNTAQDRKEDEFLLRQQSSSAKGLITSNFFQPYQEEQDAISLRGYQKNSASRNQLEPPQIYSTEGVSQYAVRTKKKLMRSNKQLNQVSSKKSTDGRDAKRWRI